MIQVKKEAVQAIEKFMAQEGETGPLRVELGFSGCCDPSLRLVLDRALETDHVVEVEGLLFLIDPKTSDLTGEVTINHVDQGHGRQGFVLTSANPVSEWEGMTCVDIIRRNNPK